MKNKSVGIVLGILIALIALAVGGYFYMQGDHSGPAVTTAENYEASYGQRIGIYDLIRSISDQSKYSVAITKGGQIAADGQSTTFDKSGTAQVEITAKDELGHTTVRNVSVKVVDKKPPMLNAKDITVSLGDPVDYRSGVTADDEMDGNLNSAIAVDSSRADETVPGIYPIVYTVSDKSGNEARVCVALTIKNPEAEDITLSQQTLSLEGNGHYQLAATVEPKAWNGEIVWSTSDDSVAVVSDGLISWVGYGSCTITAEAGDASSSCQVSCGYVSVSSAYLDKGNITLKFGESAELNMYTVPSNWYGDVIWSSSDNTVATVYNGVVEWAGQGECVITASADGRTSTCVVTCTEPSIESLTISETSLTLKARESKTVTVSITPESWPGDVAWSSSDTDVAVVTDGKIRWVGEGSCTITAVAGSKTASCNVTCEAETTIGDIIGNIIGGGDDTGNAG